MKFHLVFEDFFNLFFNRRVYQLELRINHRLSSPSPMTYRGLKEGLIWECGILLLIWMVNAAGKSNI